MTQSRYFTRLGAVVCLLLGTLRGAGQRALTARLDQQVKQLLAAPGMQHALLGFTVLNTATGQLVYDWRGSTGLAPASTQKLFTAAASLELLGPVFRYATLLLADGDVVNGVLQGNLVIKGAGDPSLGSWRYAGASRAQVLRRIAEALTAKGIRSISGNLVVNDTVCSYQPLPGGWIWDDIGNYYGAGSFGLNWNENQYDLQLKPGAREGDPVQVLGTEPVLQLVNLVNHLRTGASGSGDNAYIYLPPYAQVGFVEGTVPAGKTGFTISGSLPDPVFQFGWDVQQYLQQQGISTGGTVQTGWRLLEERQPVPAGSKVLDTLYSPPLDSLAFWFLQKSINLYGEALLKTLASRSGTSGSTQQGVKLLRGFWQQRGIDPAALHLQDGCGLSPQNRVTAQALTQVLQYARHQPWFGVFYQALPLYNHMHMKSGTIAGAKSFAGYQASRNGNNYTFALLVNNYDGPANMLVQQLYEVLDVLK